VVSGPIAGDLFSTARSAAKATGFLESVVDKRIELVAALAAWANETTKAVIERLAEADGERIAEYGELLEMISEFGAELNDEDHVREGIASVLQQMEILAQQIRALEAEGLRLQNER